jgi:hypothetical protein
MIHARDAASKQINLDDMALNLIVLEDTIFKKHRDAAQTTWRLTVREWMNEL